MTRIKAVLATVATTVAVASVGAATLLLPPGTTIESEFGTLTTTKPITEQMAAKELLTQAEGSYISVITSTGESYELAVRDIVAAADTDGVLGAVKELPCIKRIAHRHQEVRIAPYIVVDKYAVQSFLNEVNPNQEPPKDAEAVYDAEQKMFVIVPEEVGSTYVRNAKAVVAADILSNPSEPYVLKDHGAYVKAHVTQDDKALKTLVDAYNAYKDGALTYTVDEMKETVDFDDIHKVLAPNYTALGVLDGAEPVVVDKEKVAALVKELAETYTTYGKPHTFHTTTGKDVELTYGDYGWLLDEQALADDIYERVSSKESATAEFPFAQKAMAFVDGHDYTDTYVEISIEDQHLWYYVDGELAMETNVVTGGVYDNHDTRVGIFSIDDKKPNRTLRGPGYASFVRYWMPFDKLIGMHDASWRSAFGGKIYLTNGSHGCVNMPTSAARFMFENVDMLTPVIVY